MNKNVVFLLLLLSFGWPATSQPNCPIIPLPAAAENTGAHFLLDDQTVLSSADPQFAALADYFKQRLLHYTGIALARDNGRNRIVLLRDANVNKKGSYRLEMRAHQMVLRAAGTDGLFNGLMSLLQLSLRAPEQGDGRNLPCWTITDAPRYEWRGLMLDESRHFFGKQMVKTVLDEMALNKLNRFHWHLTDAPGWRLTIKKYPLLTLRGGVGNKTDSLAPARYYTQADIAEIVAYGKQRHITVIPEFDMPGHATAANRAYPRFSGGGSGRFANFTFNPGLPDTYTYLTNILKEIAVLFPSGTVHLGGDEVAFGSKSWASDPAVQQLMQQQGLKDVKAVEQYFFQRMTDSALQFFDQVGAWDEAVQSDLPADSILIFWWRHNLPDQLNTALEKGYRVVLCPRIPLYFDFVQDSTHHQGRRWKGDFSSLQQVYDFSEATYPVASTHTDQIQGIQANLWTETLYSNRRLEFLLFPRMAALAEAAWTPADHRDYAGFLQRLKPVLARYRAAGYYYFNPLKPDQTPEAVDL